MIDEFMKEFYEKIPKEKVYINEPMSKHTSFKIGGPADVFIKATTVEEVKAVIGCANKNSIPLHIIGNGSNILVKDEGIKGIVLKPQLDNIHIKNYENDDSKNKVTVTVGSGVMMGLLAQKLMQEGITGFEELSGIPGTIGGAIRMNAGAHGKEMKDIIQTTTYIDMQGNIHTITNEEQQFSYRSSIFAKEKYIILETTLKLQYGDKEKIQETMEQYAKWRKENQPLEYPNAGSTFKRGKDFITAQLIDNCGLKGYTIGGAQVSTKHAGFIVNIGNATAKDVLNLVKYVQEQVLKQTGKQIELEIEVI